MSGPLWNVSIANGTIEWMLSHAIRCREVFDVAAGHMAQNALWQPGETECQLVWAYTMRHVEQTGELPSQEYLEASVSSATESAPYGSEGDADRARSMIGRLYDVQIDYTSFNPTAVLDVLKTFLHERQVGDYLQHALRSGSNLPSHVLEDAYERMQTIEAIGQSVAPTVGSLMPAYRQRLAERRGRQIVGLRTGMGILDERLCGLRDFTVLASAPNVGKTVLALQIALGVCRHHEENDAVALYLSLDMPTDDLLDRINCYFATVDWKTFVLGSQRNGEVSDADLRHERSAERLIYERQIDRRLSIIGRESVGPNLSASTIVGQLMHLQQSAGAQRALLVIDYLQLLPIPESRYEQKTDIEQDKARVKLVQKVLDDVKRRLGADNVAALVIAEARKPSTSAARESWGRNLQDLMGSARLGYAADAALLLQRTPRKQAVDHYGFASENELAQLDSEGICPLTFSLAKGRDGMTRGEWQGEFFYRQSRIQEGITQRPRSSAPIGRERNNRPQPMVEGLDADLGLE